MVNIVIAILRGRVHEDQGELPLLLRVGSEHPTTYPNTHAQTHKHTTIFITKSALTSQHYSQCLRHTCTDPGRP